jgi:hypothetical protein
MHLEPVTLHGWRAPEPLLSEEAHRTEAHLGYALAVEHIRITGSTDARETAAYANTVLGNCRARASDDLRGYLPLVRKHLLWMRSLPAGSPVVMAESVVLRDAADGRNSGYISR